MRFITVGALLVGLALSPTLANAQALAGRKATEIDLPTLGGTPMKL